MVDHTLGSVVWVAQQLLRCQSGCVSQTIFGQLLLHWLFGFQNLLDILNTSWINHPGGGFIGAAGAAMEVQHYVGATHQLVFHTMVL